jgi:phenylacetate-CoA ligase
VSAYEHLFRNALYPAYETGLRRRGTLRYLREYERSQWLPREQLLALQWDKLQRLVAHCWEHVPYYRTRWRELGIAGPGDLRTREDFARLPVLTKPEIRAHFDALVAPAWRDRLLFKTTGGSTGEPLRFGYTRESYERRIAVMHRGYGWSGARLGQRTLYLWGLPEQQTRKDRLYHAAFNRRMLNAFDMHDAHLPDYADAFARFRPETVIGYVAPLVRFATWLEQSGRRLPAPARVLTAAEALHAPQRELLERAFGCPVFNTYGCRETMLLASECTHGSLHTTADHVLLETGAAPDGCEAGPRDLLLTDLHNYGMPLLRYANGDLATAGGQHACACGRGLPTLRSVDGRKLDALYSVDGRFVPGEMVVYAMLGAQGVRRYQAVQTAPDRVEMRVVRDAGFAADSLEHGRAFLQRALGPAARLEFAFVDDIPLTPSGKHRVTVSELQ